MAIQMSNNVPQARQRSSDPSQDSNDQTQQLLAAIEEIIKQLMQQLQQQSSNSDDDDDDGAQPAAKSSGGGGGPSAAQQPQGAQQPGQAMAGNPANNAANDPNANGANGTNGAAGPQAAPPDAAAPTTASSAQPNGSGFFSPDPAIQRWAPDIEKAAKATGLDPNLLGGQMWAESRGDPNHNTTNIDGTQDLGLMQIGQERWNRDIVPKLSAQDRSNITAATGKSPEQLDLSNPHDNVIAGAFHLKQYIDQNGGSTEAGLKAYVGIGDEGTYAQHVMTNQAALAAHQHMDPTQ